jgi:hypothetical protein
VGGDFNLVLSEAEKSTGNVNHQTFLFNDWMNKWALIDLPISNRSFTWANNQDNLILATLDHIIASTEWDRQYPLSLVRAIPKSGSDPLSLLSSVSKTIKLKKISSLKNGGYPNRSLSRLLPNYGQLPYPPSFPRPLISGSLK